MYTVTLRRDEEVPVWSRRAVLGKAGSVLAGAAGAALTGTVAGCRWWEGDSSSSSPPDPLAPLLASTRALVARYERVLEAHPDLTGRLGPLVATHTAHAAALAEMTGDRNATARPGRASAGPSTDPSAAPSAGSSPATTPAPQAAVAGLREAEREALEEAVQACLVAAPERLARLGSICAARATHPEVLS